MTLLFVATAAQAVTNPCCCGSTTSTTVATTTTVTTTTAASTTTTTAGSTTTTTTVSTTTTTTGGGGFCAGAHNYAADAATLGCWHFESGALTTDSCGANTLTNHGTTADTVNFKEGAASDLAVQPTGVVDLDCTDAACPSLNIGARAVNTQRMTVGCWWRAETSTVEGDLMGHEFNEDGWRLSCAADGGGTCFADMAPGDVACGAAQDFVGGTTLTVSNQWYHVGLSSDNTTLRLFVDGGLDGTGTHTGGVCATTDPFEWNGSVLTGFANQTTEVDECFFRNDALLAADFCAICRCGYDGAHADRGAGVCTGCP